MGVRGRRRGRPIERSIGFIEINFNDGVMESEANVKNPVVHFEIGSRDHAKVCKFYSDLFGWDITPSQPFVNPEPAPFTIGGHVNCLGHEPHNYVTVYVQVDDLDAMLKRAEELGGKRIVPPTEVPGVGRFAWMQDVEGNLIGLWKPMPK